MITLGNILKEYFLMHKIYIFYIRNILQFIFIKILTKNKYLRLKRCVMQFYLLFFLFIIYYSFVLIVFCKGQFLLFFIIEILLSNDNSDNFISYFNISDFKDKIENLIFQKKLNSSLKSRSSVLFFCISKIILWGKYFYAFSV